MRFNVIQLQEVKKAIELCQGKNHIQQVAFSTYHNCLTQICFTCKCIRTELKEKII